MIHLNLPTFGQFEYAEQCIASLLPSLSPDVQLIVLDDGSPDDTAAKLADLLFEKPYVRFIGESENVGVVEARNKMLKISFSDPEVESVVLTESDTIVAPYTIENLLSFWRSHKEYWMVCGTEIGTEVEHFLDFVPFDNRFPLTLHRWCLALLPRHTYEVIGPIDSGFDRYGFNDTDYFDMIQCAPHYKPVWSTCLAPYIHLHGSHRSWFTDDRVLRGILNSRRYYIAKWEARGRDMSHMQAPGNAYDDWERRLAEGESMDTLIAEAKQMGPDQLVSYTNETRAYLNKRRIEQNGG